MLNAVLFDLDNTLIDRDQAFRECVGHSFSDPAVQREIIELDRSGTGDRTVLFNRWEQHSGCQMNQSLFGHMIAERLRPDSALLRELRTLSQKTKIGIITNGGSETQRQKLAAAGFKGLFPTEHIWISEEVGSAKPAAGIFLAALNALGEPPERCLFIGDSEEYDIRAALGVGMRARLVDHVLDRPRLRELIEQEYSLGRGRVLLHSPKAVCPPSPPPPHSKTLPRLREGLEPAKLLECGGGGEGGDTALGYLEQDRTQ